MKIEKGQKIRITRWEGTKAVKSHFKVRIGTIEAVNEYNFTVQFKNYRESFNVSDFQQYDIEVRVDKKWVKYKIK